MRRQYVNGRTYHPQGKKGKKKWFLVIFFALLLAFLLLQPLNSILIKLFNGLMPFFIALIVVFILKQPRKMVANKLLKNAFKNTKNPYKWRMNIALIIVFLLFLALVAGAISLVVPKLINIVEEVVTNADAYLEKLKLEIATIIEKVDFLENIISQDVVNKKINDLVSKLNNLQPDLPNLLSTIGVRILNFVSYILLGIVFAFLILLNIDKYKNAFEEWYTAYHSKEKVQKVKENIHLTDKIFVDYGFSKLIEGLVILASVTIGLIICGSSMSFELALFMALLNVIPYVGPIIALVPILLINLVLKNISIAFISTLVALLIVIFVTSFITPLIIGKKIKIDIFTVLLSLTVGGALFGAVGMIFAPPIVATTIYLIKNKINSKK